MTNEASMLNTLDMTALGAACAALGLERSTAMRLAAALIAPNTLAYYRWDKNCPVPPSITAAEGYNEAKKYAYANGYFLTVRNPSNDRKIIILGHIEDKEALDIFSKLKGDVGGKCLISLTNSKGKKIREAYGTKK